AVSSRPVAQQQDLPEVRTRYRAENPPDSIQWQVYARHPRSLALPRRSTNRTVPLRVRLGQARAALVACGIEHVSRRVHRILDVSRAGTCQIHMKAIVSVHRPIAFVRSSDNVSRFDTPSQHSQRPTVMDQLDLGRKLGEPRPRLIAVKNPRGDILPVRVRPMAVQDWQ